MNTNEEKTKAELIEELRALRTQAEARSVDEGPPAGEEGYWSLVENAPDIVYAVSAEQATIASLNPAFEKVTGQPRSAWIGKSFLALVHPDDRPIALDSFERVRKGETSPPHRLRILASSGEYLVCEFTTSPMVRAGKVVAALSIARDITECVRIEQSLQAALARFEAVIENAPLAAIQGFDRSGTIHHWNSASEQLYGFTTAEVLGRHIQDILPPAAVEQFERMLEEIWQTGRAAEPREWQVYNRAGEERWVYSSLFPVLERGAVAEVFCMGVDVTARRQAENELRKNEQIYRAVVEDAPVLLCRFGPRGVITFANEAYCQYFGKKREDLVGKDFLSLIAEQDREFVRSQFNSLTPQKPTATYEHRVIAADGTVRRQRCTDRAVFDEQGGIVSFQSTGQDITEQRLLEEELRQSQKMGAIGQLAGGVAHNFNNLLTGILGHADLLKIALERGTEAYESATVIENAAQRAAKFTRQLLAFARKGKHQNVPVDLHEAVRRVTTLLRHTIERNIRITQRLDAPVARVMGDPSQIQQTILNLAINARDAMPEGGELTLETAVGGPPNGEPEAPPQTPGQRYVMLDVTDTGCGIPEEDLKHIFEPFFTTKADQKATGLGLATVYGITKNHGGFVRVSSRVGQGTTFRVYLPAAEPPEGAPLKQTEAGDPILLVDDEHLARDVSARLLEKLGYDVVTASSGNEALEYYRQHQPEISLVIVDMMMPEMDGRACLRALKQIDPDVKVVLFTGYSVNTKGPEEILEEGALGLIRKPCPMEQFGAAVRAAISGERFGVA